MRNTKIPASGRGPDIAPGKARLRRLIVEMPPHLIGEVARIGIGQKDIIPLWYGGSDVPTPAFISDAAYAAMQAGETFYTHKLGLPELREALGMYLSGLYQKPVAADRVSVTTSGMNAIMPALMAILDAGDNMVLVDPV